MRSRDSTVGSYSKFTYSKFAITTLSVMGVFTLLFIGLMIAAYFYIEIQSDKNFGPNFPFSIPAFLYLSFIMGWAVSYTKYFRFPANQKVLLLGVAIGAFVFPTLAGIMHLLSGNIGFSEMLNNMPEALLGSLLGSAMQLYFVVLCFRYIRKFRWPF